MSLLPPDEENEGQQAMTVDQERLLEGDDDEDEGGLGLGSAFGAPD